MRLAGNEVLLAMGTRIFSAAQSTFSITRHTSRYQALIEKEGSRGIAALTANKKGR
jgi:hypothetical protein